MLLHLNSYTHDGFCNKNVTINKTIVLGLRADFFNVISFRDVSKTRPWNDIETVHSLQTYHVRVIPNTAEQRTAGCNRNGCKDVTCMVTMKSNV